MALTGALGFPRIGAQRELKKALESFWKGDSDEKNLRLAAAAVKTENWKRQKEAGIDFIASGDFTLYDHVLDHSLLFGAIPKRYETLKGDPLTLYFAMARGYQKGGVDVVAMEMTKWFDTNYHYIVPEFSKDTEFALAPVNHVVNDYLEAKAQGVNTRPVIIGPISYLLLGKMRDNDGDALSLLPSLLPVYNKLLLELKGAGVEWVQIDEPFLATDVASSVHVTYKVAYESLKGSGLKLMLTTYFAGLRDNAALAFGLPVDGVHVDLVREPEQLEKVLKLVRPMQLLSLGVIDGRNIWKTNFERALAFLVKASESIGSNRIIVAPSCSLLHSPVDLVNETKLDPELHQWLAFAQQKLEEVVVLAAALNDSPSPKKQKTGVLEANKQAIEARKVSKLIHNDVVKQRLRAVNSTMLSRKAPFSERVAAQAELLKLPPFPTTTIGSFPQTQDVRSARANFKAGRLSLEKYEAFLEDKIRQCVKYQDDTGIDVPVHGEFERNDMVEYFGEQLKGFTFTSNGWVQSYGSRCVKPPVIFGDVSRSGPMTVRWSEFAQSLTSRPMKGMLTGPVTILQWSFVRDDQSRELTCKQIALAIRDEVLDLERAGIRLIQIDEPALREGLPLRVADRDAFLKWAVDSFRLSASGVENATQIHTHMCYCEFNDIMESIAALDADVISIETSRSAMELLSAFSSFAYPNHIGPGVYDIHSPRVPSKLEMVSLLRKALLVLKPEQIWVNPDCGLKTRGWKEVELALQAMVEAAREVREEISGQSKKN